MKKEEITIITLAVWLTLIAVFMLLAKSVNLEIFFILSLLGIIMILQFIEPNYIRPGYLQYIDDILTIGIAIFVLIAVKKVMEILAK
jgi:hypothetical protein